MSLREKIFNIIYIENGEVDYVASCIQKRDEILKLIETKLEELYQSDEILGYTGNEDVHYGITLFHDKVKELLK